MSHLLEWARRLAGTFRRGRSDADLEEELRSHSEMAAESLRRAGESSDAAFRTAVHEHGGVAQAMAAQRDQRGLLWLADIGRDVRYGLRGLVRNRIFSMAVVVLLALGIGTTTSFFSLINALMWRTLPVRAPEQLVQVLTHYPDPGEPRMPVLDWTYYEIVRDRNHVFTDFVGSAPTRFQIKTGDTNIEDVRGEYVVGSFFPALGILPAAGRLIRSEDDHMEATTDVAVVSWSYWKRHFNFDPAVVGTRITVNGVPVSVVGVAPRAFTGMVAETRADVWMPAATARRGANGNLDLVVIGRLKPSVTREQARAEISVLIQRRFEERAARSHDDKWRRTTVEIEPASAGFSAVRDRVSQPLFVLMAGSGLLLLIACTNVASLLIARGAARRREMALRVSLGAGRFRLVRQVMTESLLLAAAGTLVGLFLAYFGSEGLLRILDAMKWPGKGALEINVRPDKDALLFASAAGLGTALLFGLLPALQAFSLAPASSLREIGAAAEPKSSRLLGTGLIVAQIALSAVLLSSAGLFARYLADLRSVGLGFNPASVLLVSLNPQGSRLNPAMLTPLYRTLLDRLQAIPGVRSVTLSATTPIAGGSWLRFGRVEGFDEAADKRQYLYLNAVAPKYFETYGTALLAGRDFEFQDANRSRVAIVNQATARHYFAERSPLGRQISFDNDALPYEIIGVVADAKYDDLHRAAPRTVYVNAFQDGRISSHFGLRTDVPPLSLVEPVRRAVEDAVKPVRIENVSTLVDQLDASLVLERAIATLSSFFGLLGTVVAAVGLYGLLAYAVARRTSEIGIRMALGATRRDITRMVLKSGMSMLLAGLLLGMPVAIWSKDFAATMIENLPLDDPLPIAFALVTISVVAVVATYVPARRAARVHPSEALRHD